MKITGEATLYGSAEQVYAALHDPQVLVRTIPGCQRLEQVGEDAYQMMVNAGVASIKGAYSGDVLLTDARPPHGFVLRASGAGAPGTIAAEVDVRLVPGADGETLLRYDADAQVGGMIGGVGQRMLAGVARKTADEFFVAVNQLLAATPAAEAVGAAEAAGVPETAGAEASRVFTRPVPPAGAPGALPTGFVAGAVFGAGIALLGALVGGLVAARSGRRRQ